MLSWWTFAGGRAHAALAREHSRRLDTRFATDNFSIHLGTPPAPEAVERAIADLRVAEPTAFVPAASEAAVAGLKFSECLPDDLDAAVSGPGWPTPGP